MSPLRLRRSEHEGFVLNPPPEAKLSAQHQRMPSEVPRRTEHRRQPRGSSFAPREKRSIHLESAPWLGYDRSSQAARSSAATVRDTAVMQAPRDSKPHLWRPSSASEQQRRSRNLTSSIVNGSSDSHPLTSLHATASAADAMLSSSSRKLLQRKAVQISHALVRRANQMITNVERSRALSAGSRRSRRMEIEGYRFLYMSKSGVAVYEDASSIRLENKASSQPRYIGIAAVKATIDEFIDTFGRDSEQGFSQLNPDLASCRQIHSISEEQDRRVGINWMAMQPTWTGSLARRRDFVVLGCEEVFSTDSGSRNGGTTRRGWAQTMHSVQLPWCPSMEKSSSIVRASMYQTGTVVLEAEASSEWLHVVSIVEIDMKGSVTERSQRASALRRVESLEIVAPTLMNRRIQRMSMLRTKQFNAAKPRKEAHCSVCTQRLGITSLRLHHYCRKCAATVCSDCSRNWQLDPATKKKTRICRLCVMSSRPSKVFTNSWIGSVDDGRDGAASSSRRLSRQGEDYRASGAPASRSEVAGAVCRSDSSATATSQSLHRTDSHLTSRSRASRRYFDLPMDASELGPLSDNDENDCKAEAVYSFSDARAVSVQIDNWRASSSKGTEEMLPGLEWGDLESPTRISQTVAEDDDEDDDEVLDNDFGYSVGPSGTCFSPVVAPAIPKEAVYHL